MFFMDGKNTLKNLCKDLNYDSEILAHSLKVYDSALIKGMDKKYKYMALAAGSLYFYCKSTGKPIILRNILDALPVDSEEVISFYNEMKRYTLR